MRVAAAIVRDDFAASLGQTRCGCKFPCKEQAGNRDASRAIVFSSMGCLSPALMPRSIAAPRERNAFRSREALRCVSKHEGARTLVLILRDARTHNRLCTTCSARALLRMRTSIARAPVTSQNAPLRSRGAFLRPGLCKPLLRSPRTRGAERRETFGCSGTRWACTDASKTRVNALMTRDARLSALHRRGFGLRGRASLTGICAGSV
jgi:hypothetical protein